MRLLPVYLLSIIPTLLLISCKTSKKEKQETHQAIFVTGSTNNKLEILDFGGKGEPLLFLTGLGNSAHVFDDFAPKFCDSYHVYAMTRRGFGASEQTPNGYRIDTLSMDILAVTKALKMDKVILVGHSIAGDEISKFASSYPDKVKKVIYLDAAYDRTNLMSALMPYFPGFPAMTEKDSSSFENFRAFTRKMGVPVPDEELKSTSVFSAEGKYLKGVTPEEIQGKIIMGVERPDYKNIKCPALSIYAMANSVAGLIPFYDLLDTDNKKKADTCFTIFKDFYKEQTAVFKKEVKNGTVKEIKGADHYVFISNPKETEKFIREFLN